MDYIPADPGVFDGWRNSLLVTSLKNGALYCLRLTQDGDSVQGDITQFFKTTNRYRDLAPDCPDPSSDPPLKSSTTPERSWSSPMSAPGSGSVPGQRRRHPRAM
jgi:hypothetical protein